MGFDVIYLLLSIVFGFNIGIFLNIISKKLIYDRTQKQADGYIFEKRYSWIFWSLTTAIGYGILFIQKIGFIVRIENILLFSACLCIGIIDFKIKKIPNELLLLILSARVIFLATRLDKNEIVLSIIGFFAGFILFMIPSYFNMAIGGGDIKLAAVVGFALGAYGLLEVMIVMAIGLAFLAAYLLITKKGDLKTSAAMGPFISIGVIVTIIHPILK
jgi:leader peptidase (prepilin peptidase)/N-methyltransferase